MGIALVTGGLLLVPLVAMQFTDDVVWGPFDFIVAGALLFSAGLSYQLVAQKAVNTTYRAGAGLAVGTALFLIWANLAVGVIGDEGDPIGIISAFIARFQSHGMTRALVATALAQALVVVVALIAGKQQAPHSSVAEIVMVNGFFVALWLGSAMLFRSAAVAGQSSELTKAAP